MRGYLESYAINVVTDHQSLRWLLEATRSWKNHSDGWEDGCLNCSNTISICITARGALTWQTLFQGNRKCAVPREP